jgi:sortase A
MRSVRQAQPPVDSPLRERTPAQAEGTGKSTTLGGVHTAALEPQGIQIKPQATARRATRFLASKILTITELITVSALVVVVILAVTNLATLNEEAAAEQRRQLTPTAELPRRRAVLPGSSQPPPGEGEVPPQFRPYLMPSTPVPLPTPGPRQATRIVIKKIRVDAPVLEGDDWQTLKKGVGHTPGTANPGEAGNCVLSGHDDVYGEVFRYLSDLKSGDEVLVYTSDGQGFKYVVKTSFLVLPDAVEVLDPTPDPVLTLITCYPYLIDSHRLIVVCTLEGEAPTS